MDQLSHTALARVLDKLVVEAGDGSPVCLAIANAHGDLLALLCMDGTPRRSIAIAQGKAYTSARIGLDTSAFHLRLQKEALTLADFCDSRLTSIQGGVVIQNEQGTLLGGLGISGRKPEDDEKLALRLRSLLLAAS